MVDSSRPAGASAGHVRAVSTDTLHFPERAVVTLPIVPEELSGVRERPVIILQADRARPQRATTTGFGISSKGLGT
jgi:hypothetical protein